MKNQNLYKELQALERRGESGALCTVVRTRGAVPRRPGAKMLVYPDGRIIGTVGGGQMESLVVESALDVLRSGESQLVHYTLLDPKSGDPGVCGGTVDIFVDPVSPDPILLVVGGGHVGAELVHLGHWLGFHVVLSDDRSDFCTPQAVPGADEYIPGDASTLINTFIFHSETYVVLVTRSVDQDLALLPGILECPHAYIGVIGSQRRWKTTCEGLEALGVSTDKLSDIHSPVGIELNAETPREIALSIMAELIMLRRGGSGRTMSTRD